MAFDDIRVLFLDFSHELRQKKKRSEENRRFPGWISTNIYLINTNFERLNASGTMAIEENTDQVKRGQENAGIITNCVGM